MKRILSIILSLAAFVIVFCSFCSTFYCVGCECGCHSKAHFKSCCFCSANHHEDCECECHSANGENWFNGTGSCDTKNEYARAFHCTNCKTYHDDLEEDSERCKGEPNPYSRKSPKKSSVSPQPKKTPQPQR